MAIPSPTAQHVKATSSTKPGGWFRTPNTLFERKISVYAKIVYMNLCRHADKSGRSFPSHERIAAECSTSVATVKRAINELIRAGLATLKSRGHSGRANVYSVLWHRTDIAQRERCQPPEIAQTDPSDSSESDADIAPTEPPRTTQGGTTHLTQSTKQGGEKILDQTNGDEVRQLVHDFYRTVCGFTPLSAHLQKGSITVSQLLTDGCSVADIRSAIAYIPRHPEKFKHPVKSIGILPYLLADAKGEEQRQEEAAARRARRKAEEEALIERETREYERSLSPRFKNKLPPTFRDSLQKGQHEQHACSAELPPGDAVSITPQPADTALPQHRTYGLVAPPHRNE